jgi:hypothetical protein
MPCHGLNPIVNHDDKAFITPIIGESIPMTVTTDNMIILDLLCVAMVPLKKAYGSLRTAFYYEIERLHSLPPENPSEQKACDQLKINQTQYVGSDEEATHNFLIEKAMDVIQSLNCFGLHISIPKGTHITPSVTVPSGIHLYKLFEKCIFEVDFFSLKPLLGHNAKFQDLFLQNQVYIVGHGSTRLFFVSALCTVICRIMHYIGKRRTKNAFVLSVHGLCLVGATCTS